MLPEQQLIDEIVAALGSHLPFTDEQKHQFAIAVVKKKDFFITIWEDDINFTDSRDKLKRISKRALSAIQQVQEETKTNLGNLIDIIACGDTSVGQTFRLDDTVAYLSNMHSTLSSHKRSSGSPTGSATIIAAFIATAYRQFLGKEPGTTNSAERYSEKPFQTPFGRVCRVFEKHYHIRFSDEVLYAAAKEQVFDMGNS